MYVYYTPRCAYIYPEASGVSRIYHSRAYSLSVSLSLCPAWYNHTIVLGLSDSIFEYYGGCVTRSTWYMHQWWLKQLQRQCGGFTKAEQNSLTRIVCFVCLCHAVSQAINAKRRECLCCGSYYSGLSTIIFNLTLYFTSFLCVEKILWRIFFLQFTEKVDCAANERFETVNEKLEANLIEGRKNFNMLVLFTIYTWVIVDT